MSPGESRENGRKTKELVLLGLNKRMLKGEDMPG